MSYLDQPGEWETRRISIIGVAKSFISQLSIGQDLTKISLPAAFQYPYSALELGAHRSLSFSHILHRANTEGDPLKRMLCAVRWFLSATQKEKFEKKPYNPILGECHYGWVESEEHGRTRYLAEQTLHHPPLCAFRMDNPKEKMEMQGNILFAINFHGNSVSVKTTGPLRMKLGAIDEEYTFSTVLPDVAVRNVIIGTKRIAWEGDVVIECKKTGYKATMFYKEEGWYCVNVVNGTISKLDAPNQPLYTLYGALGTKVDLTNCQTNQVEVLYDWAVEKATKIQYPPLRALDDRSSLKVWTEVNKAIVVDDLGKADIRKRAVEDAQRKRRNEGTSYVPRFFTLIQDLWVCSHEAANEYLDSLHRRLAELTDVDTNGIEQATENLSLEEASATGGYVAEEL